MMYLSLATPGMFRIDPHFFGGPEEGEPTSDIPNAHTEDTKKEVNGEPTEQQKEGDGPHAPAGEPPAVNTNAFSASIPGPLFFT